MLIMILIIKVLSTLLLGANPRDAPLVQAGPTPGGSGSS